LLVYIFQSQINLNKFRGFVSVFLVLFIFSPFAYAYISIIETDKRTDYPGREIAKKVQVWWNNENNSKIDFIFGNEWIAGNLCYHLKDRPQWYGVHYDNAPRPDKILICGGKKCLEYK